MPDSVFLLAAAAAIMWGGLAAVLFGTVTRVHNLERRLRHLHRKQDEERRLREDWRSPKVKKVAR